MYSENVNIPDEVMDILPLPTGYKLLIAVPKVEEKTAGGIIRPDMLKDQEQTASIIGFVVRMGDDAYGDPSKFPTGPFCKTGDWVIMRSYSGTRFKVRGEEYRLINDDTVEGVIPGTPKEYSRA